VDYQLSLYWFNYGFLYLYRFYNDMNCPCCGGKMKANYGDKLTVFKCNSCGLSNTELKNNIK
jgi:tRNA(Ile2) C34 agmatinyltransferase TiaS